MTEKTLTTIEKAIKKPEKTYEQVAIEGIKVKNISGRDLFMERGVIKADKVGIISPAEYSNYSIFFEAV